MGGGAPQLPHLTCMDNQVLAAWRARRLIRKYAAPAWFRNLHASYKRLYVRQQQQQQQQIAIVILSMQFVHRDLSGLSGGKLSDLEKLTLT